MWDRNWTTYFVKPVFAEKPADGVLWPHLSSEEIQAHLDATLTGWECQLFQLPNPILVQRDVVDILAIDRDGKSCRVYPPFSLNEVQDVAGAFTEVAVPQGEGEVIASTSISDSAVKGLSAESSASEDYNYCRGVRLDVQAGHDTAKTLKALIDQIAQFTHQWWLRSPQAPFRGPLRLGASIDRNYQIMTELKYHGAGQVESAWYAARQLQKPLGFERPLTRGIWLLCIHNVRKSIPAETGLLSFSDALAHYMAGEDERCILDLAITFEILASKRLLADTGRTESKNKNLLEKSQLATGRTSEVIKKLILDRDHVAHGRPPFILGHNSDITMETYLDAIRQVVNRYLELVQPGEWPQLASMRLESTRRR